MKKMLKVDIDNKGKRLDVFLSENIKDISRTKIKNLIKEGKVFVNQHTKKPNYLLKSGDVISIEWEEEKSISLKPFSYNIEVIYEDEDVLVVNKPAGLVVHPYNLNKQDTLVNALLYLGKKLSSIDTIRPGVVHRLDKETSGVMILAKNNYSHLNLIKQFRERNVKKEYRAIVWGIIKENKMDISLPLRRDKNNPLKMKVGFISSKEAFTKIEVVERLKDATFLAIKPITGRMHQIRVHLNFLGFPIVGDRKYGRKDGFSQLFLHAQKIGFYHPRSNNFIEFAVEVPHYFIEFIQTRRCLK